MFNSIRGSMLIWQAVILSAAVSVFGTILYRRVRHAANERVDSDLLGAAHALASALEIEAAPRRPAIPATYRDRFGKKREDAPYFLVWDNAENLIASSQEAPALPPPERPRPKGPHPRSYYSRQREGKREMLLETASGARVLVGKSTEKQQRELVRFGAWTGGWGVAVVLVGMAGGWLVSKRVLAPIDRMSIAAEQISAASLSQRLDAGSEKSELGRLARVLNDAFDRLQEAFEKQVRFTADASHELRTPVSIILAQVEQALANERTGPQYREALAACQRAASRLKSVVDGLLVLARADAGNWSTQRQPLDLEEVVRTAAALLRPLALQYQVHVHLQLQPVEAAVNRDQIGQLVVNLLTNAIQYNREGGEVYVALAKDKTDAVLQVADTGEGIAEDEQVRIFERFYRVDGARSSRRGGSGLGLAICREIVRAHGGRITVESELGTGAKFTVRLPIGLAPQLDGAAGNTAPAAYA